MVKGGERWVPAPVFTGAGYSRGHGRVHPHPNLPPLKGEGKEGRGKGGSRTGSTVHRRVECEGEEGYGGDDEGNRWCKGRGKMGPRPRLHGGRLFARTREETQCVIKYRRD